ncbi:site-specific integrase [Mariprofundus sp. EBB-1]|uniref:tyrosine-type recombinase/integrase n=1 Tax=Mariprofundus sp. EBB-1 TaxID=2650971 RepID=UPI000EF2843C|nr:site-specific integrase [Mariprofundus sp. EBB-1]RLL48962.1 site-specific integrase [Mariprofundus sp. EBB-1]
MAIIKRKGKGGTTYRVQIWKNRKVVDSATFDTMRDAKAWQAAAEVKKASGALSGIAKARAISFIDALQKYKEEVTPNKKGIRQENSLIERLKKIEFAAKRFSDVTKNDVIKYKKSRLKKVSANTVRHELALMRHLYNEAAAEWEMDGLPNPVAEVTFPKKTLGRDRRLNTGELERLLSAAATNAEMPELIALAIETGMRRSEMTNLLWKDVDLKGKQLTLQMTKSGERRVVFLSTEALKVLKAQQKIEVTGGKVFAISANYVTVAFRRICKKTKSLDGKENEAIEDLRFHDLRHEAVSRFFEKGLSTELVMQMSGHETYEMLKRYTHLRHKEKTLELLG